MVNLEITRKLTQDWSFALSKAWIVNDIRQLLEKSNDGFNFSLNSRINPKALEQLQVFETLRPSENRFKGVADNRAATSRSFLEHGDCGNHFVDILARIFRDETSTLQTFRQISNRSSRSIINSN